MEHAGKKYGEKQIFSNANFILTKGEKIALVGRNGEGKSTMIKMIAKQIDFDGVVSLGHSVNMGYFAQDQAETVFKAFARALRAAVEVDPRAAGSIASTKGSL